MCIRDSTNTDLAQSESSLAGAQAQFAKSKSDLLISKLNYENIIGKISDPNQLQKNSTAIVSIPKSLNEANFDETISSAPTDIVSIEEIDEITDTNDEVAAIKDEPIELKSEKITDFKLYLRVIGFENYQIIRSVLDNYDNNLKYTSEKNNSKYDVIIGPLENTEANNLVSYFISKGYKETEILIE